MDLLVFEVMKQLAFKSAPGCAEDAGVFAGRLSHDRLELELEPFVIVRKNGPNGSRGRLSRRMLMVLSWVDPDRRLAHVRIMCSPDTSCKSSRV